MRVQSDPNQPQGPFMGYPNGQSPWQPSGMPPQNDPNMWAQQGQWQQPYMPGQMPPEYQQPQMTPEQWQ